MLGQDSVASMKEWTHRFTKESKSPDQSHKNITIIFDKVQKPINGEQTVHSTNSAGTTGCVYGKNKIDLTFNSHPA